jgi:hypothetical protein
MAGHGSIEERGIGSDVCLGGITLVDNFCMWETLGRKAQDQWM